MSEAMEVLTVEEAGSLLKVDSVTVQRALKAGQLPGAKVGRAWRILKDELVLYLRRQPIRIWRKGDKVWIAEPGQKLRELFKESSISIQPSDVLKCVPVGERNV